MYTEGIPVHTILYSAMLGTKVDTSHKWKERNQSFTHITLRGTHHVIFPTFPYYLCI